MWDLHRLFLFLRDPEQVGGDVERVKELWGEEMDDGNCYCPSSPPQELEPCWSFRCNFGIFRTSMFYPQGCLYGMLFLNFWILKVNVKFLE